MTNKPNAKLLLKSATRASVAVSSGLVLAKAFAWFVTGSVSIFASLLDSVMDTITSLTNMVAVNYSLKPPDSDHRFGHGKAEALAGLLQAMFIAGSAIFLLVQAATRLLEPQTLSSVNQGIWIIGAATLVTLALVIFQRYVVAQTGSTAIRADSLHYVTDIATNLATLAALYLAQIGFIRADGLFGAAIGILVLASAVRVGLAAMRLLMDEELPEAERESIINSALEVPGVADLSQLRSWRSGQRSVIQLELQFDGKLSLHQVHATMEEVRRGILRIDAEADVSIEPSPSSASDP